MTKDQKIIRAKVGARGMKIAFASACPWDEEWRLCAQRLSHARGSPA